MCDGGCQVKRRGEKVAYVMAGICICMYDGLKMNILIKLKLVQSNGW